MINQNSEFASTVRLVAGSLALMVGLCSPVSAQSTNTVSFQVKLRATTYTCGLLAGKMRSGRLDRSSAQFVPYSVDIKALKAKIKKASAAKKPALKKKLAALIIKAAAGDRVCKNTAPGQAPTPTPTPGATAGPTKTPTPAPATGNFDSQGNVTAAGKVKFGIPSNLSANKNAGQAVYNTPRSSNLGMKSCGGCHGERANRSYSYMQAILPSSIMQINLTAGDLANLTAYINRSQTP